jgi:outer membrane biosynthesis protein TonB
VQAPAQKKTTVIDKQQKLHKNSMKKPDMLPQLSPPRVEQKSAEKVVVHPEQSNVIPLASVINTASSEGVTNHVQNRDEILYEEIHAAVMRVWRPPRGIRVIKPVSLRVVLDAHGIVMSVEIVESSGVVAFDVAARRASKCASYPRTAWNGTTIIKFM